MEKTMRQIKRSGWMLLSAIAVLMMTTAVLAMTGCGGFRFEVDPPGPDAPVGQIAEGVGNAAKTVGAVLPPPWNWIATAAGGLLAGGGVTGAVAAKKTKQVADQDFEDGYAKGKEAARAENA